MKSLRLLGFLRRVRPQAFQISVVAALGAIGFWGHKTHWQLSASHAEANDATHVPAAAAAVAEPRSSELKPAASAGAATIDESPPSGRSAASGPALIEFPSERAVADMGVKCGFADRREMTHEINASAVVQYDPTRLARLSTRVAGAVWRVEKQLGESIEAGDVLAIVDSPALGDAKAEFLHSMADVQLREKIYEKLHSFANGEVSGRQVQEAETELRKARVDLFNSQQALISLGFTIDLDEWQRVSEPELERRIKFLGLPEHVTSQLDPNATTATLLPIYAPFSGVVIGRELAKGEIVSPSQNNFEIADVSRMWIVLDVREKDADALELGQTVTFTAGKATITSKISWINTAVDEKTRTVEVRCEADNPEMAGPDGRRTGKRLLRANLFGVGRIQTRHNTQALALPTSAVQWFADSRVVFVRTGPSSFAPRQVKLGIMDDGFCEITAGLTSEESVVIEGSHLLKAQLQRVAVAGPP